LIIEEFIGLRSNVSFRKFEEKKRRYAKES